MIRVATAPMNWNNDDVPDLRPFLPIEQVLAEMVEAGYEGTEYGTGFPADPEALRRLLGRYGLTLASNFCWVALHDRERQAAEMARALEVARTLGALDVSELILGMRGDERRLQLAGRVPADGSAGLSAEAWRVLAHGVQRLASACTPLGVRLAVHPHAGSYVETRDELERLLALTEPEALGLCLDTGHLVYGGADPIAVVAAHGARVRYVHLKDVNLRVLDSARRNGLGFLGALKAYVFCGLGHGGVDLDRFMGALREAHYSGWLVIEEDTSPDPPLLAARRNRRYLKARYGI
ncbi:MAG: TIM barrel protein [Candidatus Methylomirabilales bacterium]